MSGRVRIMTRVITQNGIKVSASPDLPSGHFCRVLLPQLAAPSLSKPCYHGHALKAVSHYRGSRFLLALYKTRYRKFCPYTPFPLVVYSTSRLLHQCPRRAAAIYALVLLRSRSTVTTAKWLTARPNTGYAKTLKTVMAVFIP